MRAVQRCRGAPQLVERPRASAEPLDFSLDDLFENEVVERLLSDELLQLRVLFLELAETLRSLQLRGIASATGST